MTTTYNPFDPHYLDERDLRQELERVFDICHGCRLCFNLCPSFPTLFNAIDSHNGAVEKLSHTEQNQVIEECYQCKLCYIKCPYIPPHEWGLDFPRMMVRATAVFSAKKEGGFAKVMTDQFLGRTDLLGKVSSASAPLVNKISGKQGSFTRKMMEKTVGIHSERILPSYAKQRFSVWFKKRSALALESPISQIALFPTCFVEYMEPKIGKDAVAVLEHNNIACSLPDNTKCCGAPWLHNGNINEFVKKAQNNVKQLASEVRTGKKILVAQPTCSYVIRKDYPLYVQTKDAELVANNTFDLAEFLIEENKRAEDKNFLKTDFKGVIPQNIIYHLSCHSRAQNIGYRGRDLLKITGAKVTLVERCAGIDGTWGYRKENYNLAKKVIKPLKSAINTSDAETCCGDCHLANTAIYEETNRLPEHPISVLARAYGIEAT
ncbi:MAG: heterodisulfide reductase-related iron-sulfur binding cluster [Firmicutes bacterium]|nr:heterodisulfide reductase-related iron-sulfur binding cluster [Bacillota bacterium]